MNSSANYIYPNDSILKQMIVEEKNLFQDYKFIKGNLKFAVIGHIEWVNFIKVDQLPKPGLISHSTKFLECPAGGGAVIAKRLRELTNSEVHFFTSLGDDYYEINVLTFLKKWVLNYMLHGVINLQEQVLV